MKYLIALFLFAASYSCNTPDKSSIEKWKDEIVDTEQSFTQMAADSGLQKAFLHFAAEDAVLMRNNNLVIGKKAIAERFKNQSTASNEASLTWEPDFVDVSESGDLGYTYGSYTYSYMDSSGSKIENKGIFHTVWKRQTDGNWLFVWD
ncbi:MAG: nuclear transport factor 2 family protein [Cyclobacteriaceae bacterium]|nr:nuclear transport factor 2 family protein [Cyclobacteriaceae bacterium]